MAPGSASGASSTGIGLSDVSEKLTLESLTFLSVGPCDRGNPYPPIFVGRVDSPGWNGDIEQGHTVDAHGERNLKADTLLDHARH